MDQARLALLAVCTVMAASGVSHPVLAGDEPLPVWSTIPQFGADAPMPIPGPAVAAQSSAAQGPRLSAQTLGAVSGPSPITLRLEYTGEVADNPIGGIHNGATYLNQFLAQLHVDTEKAFGWTGGSFVLEGFYANADSLDTQYVGAIQDPSVVDTSGVSLFRVYQAYYKQDLGNTNILIGIYDLETEFGITRPVDIFFNGAYAWTTTLDQSGLNGPSTYPNTSLALRIRETFNDHWSVQGAILDGVPDSIRYPNSNAVTFNKTNGALLIGEVDYTPTRTTKIMAGVWDYTGEFAALNQTNADGTQRQVFGSNGGYVGGATRLYSQTAHRGLDGFANIGIAGSATNLTDRSLNLGLTYTGLLDARPNDKAGFAVGIVHASTAYQAMQIAAGNGVKSYETNFELTWRAQITDWLTVQPDIQYWINPGVDPTIKNDLLFMIHFEISHVFGL